METLEVEVQIEEQPGGPDAPLRERFRRCAERRLQRLEAQGGGYPVAGGVFDILDAFEGKFVWEMTPEDLEATPPTSVILEIVSVDPPTRPESGRVRVVARVQE